MMHDQGIHHRDLHDGNILVDRKTLMPRVIDFGKTGRQVGYDNISQTNDPYREFDESRNIKNAFPRDLDQIEIYIKLINKRKKGEGYD